MNRLRPGASLTLLRPAFALSVLGLVLLAVRMAGTGTNRYGFLAWNLFLAWIPFGLLALAGARARGARRILTGLAVLMLPNAPYLLTDFIHFRLKEGFPWWYDAQLVFVFAAAGCALGEACLRLLHPRLTERFGRLGGQLGTFALCLACGLGVYLGRGPGWNSWDVFRRPGLILTNLIERVTQPGETVHAVGMTLTTAAVMIAIHLGFRDVGRVDDPPVPRPDGPGHAGGP